VQILVIDDFVLVELALAQVLQGSPHTLTGVRDPRDLPGVLAQGTRFDLALVDINFGPGCPTGLTAMRILAELSPDTAIVIESTDEERNRLLFLLASFAFFAPVALLSKASSLAQMRALIDAIDAGTLTGPGFAAGRLIGHAGCLDELIRSRTDLMLWRALVRFDKRSEVARASHVDERTVDRFTASKCAVVDRIETEFPDGASPGGRPPGPPDRRSAPSGGGPPRHANLLRLARFAQTHSHFFTDAALDGLFAARWAVPQPRRR
jgi:DNA-binding NarL/FixJ family response regulator